EADQFAGRDLQRHVGQDATVLNVNGKTLEREHHVLPRILNSLPTIADSISGSLKNCAGGRSARILPPLRATMRLEYSATRSISCSTRMIALIPHRRAASTSVFM